MKKTPIITACLMSVLVFSSSLLAQVSSDDNLISAEAALEKAIQAQPATYTTIELLPGKDSRMLYLAEGEKDGRPVFTVVDASTGKELSPAMKDGDKSLTEAIQAAGNAFSGKVISASKEFMPYYETIYTVVIKQDAQELMILLDPKTLQVIEVETIDDSMEESDFDSSAAFFEQHPGDDW